MGRVRFVEIVRGVDVELALAMAAQGNADGVNFEVVMDLLRHFADQLIHVETGEHGVGDCHQNAEVVTLTAQQVVIHIIADAALDLLGDDGHYLGEGVQTLIFRLAPWLVGITDKLAATKNVAFHRQRQQAVMTKRLI